MSHDLMLRYCLLVGLAVASSVSSDVHATTPDLSPTNACQVTDVGSFVTDWPAKRFGVSVAIEGDLAVVGASHESSEDVGGAAYVYPS